ncbi:putative GIM3-Gim complex component [Testicularia cyperi]|uniref:Prefoldin subunit 4 n=1 Tax=Testicularia cyperi TaxID=1882483 RepID=A0A317XIB1_9BASI|nr:putative GIM3-Gim complex component [Testicularia cyperi]
MRMLSSEESSNEIEVTWEDQQSINAFSRLNSTYSDLVEDLRLKKEEREALDDLSMELELADEDEKILYRIADTFVLLPHSDALERLDSDQTQINQDIDDLADKLERYEDEMKQLKVKLYGKFGDNINLERD